MESEIVGTAPDMDAAADTASASTDVGAPSAEPGTEQGSEAQSLRELVQETSVAEIPEADLPTPPGFKSSLYPYQRESLAHMLRQEQGVMLPIVENAGPVYGGVLCEEMVRIPRMIMRVLTHVARVSARRQYASHS